MYKVFKNSIFMKSEKKYLLVVSMLMFVFVIYMYVYYIFMIWGLKSGIFMNVYVYKYILVIKIIIFIVNK